ncbi:MAG: tryptophan synthase subunit beta [Elusimicrobia bacterium]|nr:tryptophan synthase subunit beta [Elusimicrobiota bacterium]
MVRKGYFGGFGGQFVPETLMEALVILEKNFSSLIKSPGFKEEFQRLLADYAGRPTPLYYSEKLSKLTKAEVFLKREDLSHTGSHKINNALGQALMAKMTGKRKIIAETGAGQHGVASATAAALLDLECSVFMGREDMRRQVENVVRMKMLGAEVLPVDEGDATLKEAVNAALRKWSEDPENIWYLLGSCVGPHPYPEMVREFQSVIGREVKKQVPAKPTHLVACIGGGSNSMGLFYPFIEDREVKMIGVEATGSASISRGQPGIFHGAKTYLLQDKVGQISPTYSVAPGLDYSGIGPVHSFLKSTGRAIYLNVGDSSALKAFSWLAKNEGIIPALESSHAIGWVMENSWKSSDRIVICLSGRGEKDMETVTERGQV